MSPLTQFLKSLFVPHGSNVQILSDLKRGLSFDECYLVLNNDVYCQVRLTAMNMRGKYSKFSTVY